MLQDNQRFNEVNYVPQPGERSKVVAGLFRLLRASLIACDQDGEEPRRCRSSRWCRSLRRWTCQWLCARWRLLVSGRLMTSKTCLH